MNEAHFKEKYGYLHATQVMKQYLDIKYLHLDCLVLFRMGDFYEFFYEDAQIASRVLGIALTARGKSGDQAQVIPMCGIPYHALENYLNRLLEDEFKIAVCEQLETPEEAKERGGYKAVVTRSVTRIITPGTITEEALLDAGKSNYLISIVVDDVQAALAIIDLSILDFAVTSLPIQQLIHELVRLEPREILLAEKNRSSELVEKISTFLKVRISFQVDSFYALAKSKKNILEFYKIHDIAAIGNLKDIEVSAIGSIIEYVALTQKAATPVLPKPQILNYHKFMSIDASTRKNLEIAQILSGGVKGSLIWCIDHTVTKNGQRLLYHYISAPLIDKEVINSRLDITDFFYQNIDFTKALHRLLADTSDLERCITRLNMHKSTPKDLLNIKDTIKIAERIMSNFFASQGMNLPVCIEKITKDLLGLHHVYEVINEAINEYGQNEGGFIKRSYHPKMTALYDLLENTNSKIDLLKERYRKETGIDSLKISHNNVLGFFIDVTAKHAGKMNNACFIHRQTTVNSIRYTTDELKQLENNILNAQSQTNSLEKELYSKVCTEVMDSQQLLINLGQALSMLDVYCNFALVANKHNYVRPILLDGKIFQVHQGRHPIVEQSLEKKNISFTANDCLLNDDNRIWLMTGPNMAGKSTFLRQNAIIAILAQTGSFVPAVSARVGIVDKIFSRVGAGDDLGSGNSTFMLEMLETSNILAQATSSSLVILDEVGRGTSTYDGLSIAWAVLEYIHDKIKSRCLFATHYHELTAIKEKLPALENYTVEIRETETDILFLHKIKQGFVDRSYGIYVAALAGLPKSVIKRAKQMLNQFEHATEQVADHDHDHGGAAMVQTQDTVQHEQNVHINDHKDNQAKDHLQFLYDKLAATDPDQLSPKAALDMIYLLKKHMNC